MKPGTEFRYPVQGMQFVNCLVQVMTDKIQFFFQRNNGGSQLVYGLVSMENNHRFPKCQFTQVITVGFFGGTIAEFLEDGKLFFVHSDGYPLAADGIFFSFHHIFISSETARVPSAGQNFPNVQRLYILPVAGKAAALFGNNKHLA